MGLNADVDGIAVAVTNVVVIVCLRILITWSPGDVGTGVQASFLQIYSVLLSTLLSVNRQQLSIGDVYFALTLTSPPLAAYLVVASICEFLGIKTDLYKRVKSYRRIIYFLGVSIMPLWLGVTAVLYFSDCAFTDSTLMATDSTFRAWLGELASYAWNLILPGVCPFIYVGLIGVFPTLFLFRRWPLLAAEVRPCLRSKPWGWLRLPCTFIMGAWRIIDRNHKWFIYVLFAYLDISWGVQIISIAIRSYNSGYVLSYGQVLSVFSAVPPLISTIDFIHSCRWDLLRVVQTLPRHCRAEVVYLVTGKETDHLTHDSNQLPITAPQKAPHSLSPEESQQSGDPTGPLDNSNDDVISVDTSHTDGFTEHRK